MVKNYYIDKYIEIKYIFDYCHIPLYAPTCVIIIDICVIQNYCITWRVVCPNFAGLCYLCG